MSVDCMVVLLKTRFMRHRTRGGLLDRGGMVWGPQGGGIQVEGGLTRDFSAPKAPKT